MEIWKDIQGYEGLYQVSNYGNIKSLKRAMKVRSGGFRYKPESVLSPCMNTHGRYQVQLYDKNSSGKMCLVSRLVAMAFLPNPNNLPEVNHKDECPANNHVDNLEWCTRLYNIRYGTGIKRGAEGRKRKIVANSLQGNKCLVFNGICDVKEKGFDVSAVAGCLRSKRRTYAGYWWIYADDVGKKDLLDCILI